MGYEIRCLDCDFRVARPRSALAALKRAQGQQSFFEGGEDFTVELSKSKTLAEALRVFWWDVEEDADGRIERVLYNGVMNTDFDDIERLFRVLAPFVRSGSYLEIEGEDGDEWRFQFRKGKLRVSAGSEDDSKE